jgi:hypothetical protein
MNFFVALQARQLCRGSFSLFCLLLILRAAIKEQWHEDHSMHMQEQTYVIRASDGLDNLT